MNSEIYSVQMQLLICFSLYLLISVISDWNLAQVNEKCYENNEKRAILREICIKLSNRIDKLM